MRTSSVERNTQETKIKIDLNLDGAGRTDINTKIGFFDHMLSSFGKHSLCDIKIDALGDLDVDSHHTVEDVGIVLGLAISKALGNKEGITRFGSAIIPMDETLVLCSLDLSGRAYFEFDCRLTTSKLGEFDSEMVEEFFRAISNNAKINLHIQVLKGKNNHHIIEGIFKAFARALKDAVTLDPRVKGIPSTKDIL